MGLFEAFRQRYPTTTSDYLQGLDFSYAETYSFQRGTAYEERSKAERAEYERLRRRKEKRNNLTGQEEQLLQELHRGYGYVQVLVNDQGRFHYSSEKTHAFQSTDGQMTRLREILTLPANNIPMWMCAPFYRDAIVFYDRAGEMVSVLNVCLSCERLGVDAGVEIFADARAYFLFKSFFVDLGHKVEEH